MKFAPGSNVISLDICPLTISFDKDKQIQNRILVTLSFDNSQNERSFTISDLNLEVADLNTKKECQLQGISANKQYFTDTLHQNIIADQHSSFHVDSKTVYNLRYSFLALDEVKPDLYSVTIKANIRDDRHENRFINKTLIFKRHKEVMIFH
jgi:hypothetical protein